MSRDKKPRLQTTPSKSGSRGSTLVGIFVGLILGALVTVLATSVAGQLAARAQLGGVKPPGPDGDTGGAGGGAATGGNGTAPA